MINLFQSTTIPALEHSLNFAQRRHDLLAGNMANMDTPDYQSRDLSVENFHEALADSIAAGSNPASVSPTTRDQIAYGPRDATEQVVFHDGSDVSMEHQVTEMSKNNHLHSLAITTMRSQFALLRAAITERA
jgi:flagellar basal-body rod protein FlgB